MPNTTQALTRGQVLFLPELLLPDSLAGHHIDEVKLIETSGQRWGWFPSLNGAYGLGFPCTLDDDYPGPFGPGGYDGATGDRAWWYQRMVPASDIIGTANLRLGSAATSGQTSVSLRLTTGTGKLWSGDTIRIGGDDYRLGESATITTTPRVVALMAISPGRPLLTSYSTGTSVSVLGTLGSAYLRDHGGSAIQYSGMGVFDEFPQGGYASRAEAWVAEVCRPTALGHLHWQVCQKMGIAFDGAISESAKLAITRQYTGIVDLDHEGWEPWQGFQTLLDRYMAQGLYPWHIEYLSRRALRDLGVWSSLRNPLAIRSSTRITVTNAASPNNATDTRTYLVYTPAGSGDPDSGKLGQLSLGSIVDIAGAKNSDGTAHAICGLWRVIEVAGANSIGVAPVSANKFEVQLQPRVNDGYDYWRSSVGPVHAPPYSRGDVVTVSPWVSNPWYASYIVSTPRPGTTPPASSKYPASRSYHDFKPYSALNGQARVFKKSAIPVAGLTASHPRAVEMGGGQYGLSLPYCEQEWYDSYMRVYGEVMAMLREILPQASFGMYAHPNGGTEGSRSPLRAMANDLWPKHAAPSVSTSDPAYWDQPQTGATLNDGTSAAHYESGGTFDATALCKHFSDSHDRAGGYFRSIDFIFPGLYRVAHCEPSSLSGSDRWPRRPIYASSMPVLYQARTGLQRGFGTELAKYQDIYGEYVREVGRLHTLYGPKIGLYYSLAVPGAGYGNGDGLTLGDWELYRWQLSEAARMGQWSGSHAAANDPGRVYVLYWDEGSTAPIRWNMTVAAAGSGGDGAYGGNTRIDTSPRVTDAKAGVSGRMVLDLDPGTLDATTIASITNARDSVSHPAAGTWTQERSDPHATGITRPLLRLVAPTTGLSLSAFARNDVVSLNGVASGRTLRARVEHIAASGPNTQVWFSIFEESHIAAPTNVNPAGYRGAALIVASGVNVDRTSQRHQRMIQCEPIWTGTKILLRGYLQYLPTFLGPGDSPIIGDSGGAGTVATGTLGANTVSLRLTSGTRAVHAGDALWLKDDDTEYVVLADATLGTTDVSVSIAPALQKDQVSGRFTHARWHLWEAGSTVEVIDSVRGPRHQSLRGEATRAALRGMLTDSNV